MLQNHNLGICLKLVLRGMKTHRVKTLLLASAAALTVGMYTFLFLMSGAVEEAYRYSNLRQFCSESHILYSGLTGAEAASITENPLVKTTVQARILGALSDEMIGTRNVQLAAADEAYAKNCRSFPTKGRMPEAPAEIAMDTLTMDSLGIPREAGAKVRLVWTDGTGGTRTSDFLLSGWWDGGESYERTCAWITPERAGELVHGYEERESSNLDLGVTLWREPELPHFWRSDAHSDPEKEAQAIAEAAGLDDASYMVNYGYVTDVMRMAKLTSVKYYPAFPLILVCGFLMVFSVLWISFREEGAELAGMKMLGMTPRQVRMVFLGQSLLVTVLGLLPGWALGAGLHVLVTPRIIAEIEVSSELLSAGGADAFGRGFLFTLGTVVLGYLFFVLRVNRMTPVEVLRFSEGKLPARGPGAGDGRMTLGRLAARTLRRNLGQLILSAASLLIALLILCCGWIQYRSYDEDIYLASFSPWDYALLDGSARLQTQRYNEKAKNITEETTELLRSRPEVERLSLMKTKEVELKADSALRESLQAYYNAPDENSGIPRREVMAAYDNWIRGLERLEQTGNYTGFVVAADGAFLEFFTENSPMIDGEFEREAFLSGNYAVTIGAYDDELSSLPAGAEVELGGKTFEIMAAAQGDVSVVSGGNSPEAEFNLLYLISLERFDELFPGQAYRQAAVDVKDGREASFETFLERFQESGNGGVAVQKRSQYSESFAASSLSQVLAYLIVGAVLLMIGLLNVANGILTGLVARRREFAVFESLGMTRRQLRALLGLESLLSAGFLLLILVPATAAVTWFVMPGYLEAANVWSAVFRYTLTPLWITAGILIAVSVVIPQAAVRLMLQKCTLIVPFF